MTPRSIARFTTALKSLRRFVNAPSYLSLSLSLPDRWESSSAASGLGTSASVATFFLAVSITGFATESGISQGSSVGMIGSFIVLLLERPHEIIHGHVLSPRLFARRQAQCMVVDRHRRIRRDNVDVVWLDAHSVFHFQYGHSRGTGDVVWIGKIEQGDTHRKTFE